MNMKYEISSLFRRFYPIYIYHLVGNNDYFFKEVDSCITFVNMHTSQRIDSYDLIVVSEKSRLKNMFSYFWLCSEKPILRKCPTNTNVFDCEKNF